MLLMLRTFEAVDDLQQVSTAEGVCATCIAEVSYFPSTMLLFSKGQPGLQRMGLKWDNMHCVKHLWFVHWLELVG